jgi:hypothetical protein
MIRIVTALAVSYNVLSSGDFSRRLTGAGRTGRFWVVSLYVNSIGGSTIISLTDVEENTRSGVNLSYQGVKGTSIPDTCNYNQWILSLQ